LYKDFADDFRPCSNLVSKEYIRYCKEQITKLDIIFSKLEYCERMTGLSEAETEQKEKIEGEISYYNSQIKQISNDAYYRIIDIFLVNREDAKEICSPSTYDEINSMFQSYPQGINKRIYLDFDGRYNISGRFPEY
jgi:hypothetical protein